MQFTLANVLSLCLLTAMSINAVWMSVLIYREASVLPNMKVGIEDALHRLKSHCRVIGCSVMMIFLLGILVGADLVTTCLSQQTSRIERVTSGQIARSVR